MSASRLVENFFRHEYGRLVATLSRRVGLPHVEAIEDAVQSALMKALQEWTVAATPENPSAWLFRVAHNDLMSELRQRARRGQILQQFGHEVLSTPEEIPECSLPREMESDLLRMLFVCCDDSIPQDSQLVLALKVLCGFGIREIALRLFANEASVYKRLSRARSRLRQDPPQLGEPTREQYSSRLPAVHRTLYVLFTEGYLSSHGDHATRLDLCEEAIRLASALAEHPVARDPETFALLALMHLHLARMTAREDAAGGLLLLEEQDRTLWDRRRIRIGLEWLARSAQGDSFSRYHAEAGVAAEHCLSPSFHATRWNRVVECYSLLERVSPSPIHTLNRAIAVAEWRGPEAGLAVLSDVMPPRWLSRSYMWTAVLADLHRRCGNSDEAAGFTRSALAQAPTPAVKRLLSRRLHSDVPAARTNPSSR